MWDSCAGASLPEPSSSTASSAPSSTAPGPFGTDPIHPEGGEANVTRNLRDLLEEEMPGDVGQQTAADLAAISTAISLRRIADSLDKIRDAVELYALNKM